MQRVSSCQYLGVKNKTKSISFILYYFQLSCIIFNFKYVYIIKFIKIIFFSILQTKNYLTQISLFLSYKKFIRFEIFNLHK